jgi:hypothetical protein
MYVGTRKYFCIDDCRRLRFYLTMRSVALKILSPYLFIHMKNVQIGCRMCYVYQFESNVVLHSEL